jgi:hypothetical protein
MTKRQTLHRRLRMRQTRLRAHQNARGGTDARSPATNSTPTPTTKKITLTSTCLCRCDEGAKDRTPRVVPGRCRDHQVRQLVGHQVLFPLMRAPQRRKFSQPSRSSRNFASRQVRWSVASGGTLGTFELPWLNATTPLHLHIRARTRMRTLVMTLAVRTTTQRPTR